MKTILIFHFICLQKTKGTFCPFCTRLAHRLIDAQFLSGPSIVPQPASHFLITETGIYHFSQEQKNLSFCSDKYFLPKLIFILLIVFCLLMVFPAAEQSCCSCKDICRSNGFNLCINKTLILKGFCRLSV